MQKIIRVLRGFSLANGVLNMRVNLVGVVLIFFLMCLITADVTGRYLWSAPITGTYDIGQSLIVVIVFFGFAYTQKIGANIRVESVIRLFPPRARLAVEIFGRALALFFFLCITYSSWQEAWSSWLKRESYLTLFYGGILLPIYPAKFAVPFGSALMCLQLLIGSTGHLAEVLGFPLGDKK